MDHYDRDGNQITMPEWIGLSATPGYSIVKQDKISGAWISTVWLGIDHGFGHSSVPMIFETLVDWPESEDAEIYRHSTEAEALEVHESFCAKARALPHIIEEDPI